VNLLFTVTGNHSDSQHSAAFIPSSTPEQLWRVTYTHPIPITKPFYDAYWLQFSPLPVITRCTSSCFSESVCLQEWGRLWVSDTQNHNTE
jgi:hypothetical protein